MHDLLHDVWVNVHTYYLCNFCVTLCELSCFVYVSFRCLCEYVYECVCVCV